MQSLRTVTVQHRKHDQATGRLTHKVEPWAFIRVKNEKTTLLASLNSILPVIKQGVIGYNECTDGSDEIIKKFCADNPGFIPFHYPHEIVPANSPEYETGNIPEENTLAGYYNAVLNKIPKNEWIIKIDVDQIYFPEILEHSFYLPASPRDWVIYSRLNTVIANNKIMVTDYIRPGDHWLVFNDGLYFDHEVGYKETGTYYAWEHLVRSKPLNRAYFPECSSIHFPVEKKYRPFSGNIEALETLEEFWEKADPAEFSDELLEIRKLVKTFDRS